MNKFQAQVQQFHKEVINQPTSPAEPKFRNPELRARLILEEAIETVIGLVGSERAVELIAEASWPDELYDMDKWVEPDLVEAIDGLADLVYVTLGACEDIGIELEPFLDEVHASNMTKLGGKFREDGKLLKPEGYRPPDIQRVLNSLTEVKNED